jgi:RimJ/RimL family protein N-acetyltransferase
MSTFAVRPLLPEDIPRVIDYWLKATPEYLRAMGADPAKLPSQAVWINNLERIVACPVNEAATYYLVWLVDSQAVGFNSLKNIAFGESGDMHLHMWDKESRGKGYGARLFCMAALEFYRLFQLKRIICEPSVSNPAPNRMLQRIGFPLVRTYTGASSEVSMVCELNQYEIVPETARRYLDSLKAERQ